MAAFLRWAGRIWRKNFSRDSNRSGRGYDSIESRIQDGILSISTSGPTGNSLVNWGAIGSDVTSAQGKDNLPSLPYVPGSKIYERLGFIPAVLERYGLGAVSHDEVVIICECYFKVEDKTIFKDGYDLRKLQDVYDIYNFVGNAYAHPKSKELTSLYSDGEISTELRVRMHEFLEDMRQCKKKTIPTLEELQKAVNEARASEIRAALNSEKEVEGPFDASLYNFEGFGLFKIEEQEISRKRKEIPRAKHNYVEMDQLTIPGQADNSPPPPSKPKRKKFYRRLFRRDEVDGLNAEENVPSSKEENVPKTLAIDDEAAAALYSNRLCQEQDSVALLSQDTLN